MLDEVAAKPPVQDDAKSPAGARVARAGAWLRANGPGFLARGAQFVGRNFNTLIVKLPWAIVVVFVLWIVVRGLTEHVTVIEALSVPKDLEDRGYTPEVAGKHLRDAVDKFAKSVNTTMRNPEIALQGELPNIVVPSVGISLDAQPLRHRRVHQPGQPAVAAAAA